MQATKYLIAASLLAISGTAFADGEEGAPPPDGTAAPAVTAPASTATGPGLDMAPLVVPMGKLDVHGVLPIFALKTTSLDAQGNLTSSTTLAISLLGGVTYGVADKLEVGADYAIGLKDFDATGTINGHVAYAALHNDKLDVALAADLSYNLHSGGSAIIGVGGWARYHLAPKISVFTGNPGLPHATPLGGLALFPGQYQLQFGLNNGNPVLLAIPVGVGFQAAPNIYAYASTTLAGFALSGGGSNAFFGSDFIPLTIGAFFSASDKLDVGASFSDDLKNAGDFYSIALTARYWVK